MNCSKVCASKQKEKKNKKTISGLGTHFPTKRRSRVFLFIVTYLPSKVISLSFTTEVMQQSTMEAVSSLAGTHIPYHILQNWSWLVEKKKKTFGVRNHCERKKYNSNIFSDNKAKGGGVCVWWGGGSLLSLRKYIYFSNPW